LKIIFANREAKNCVLFNQKRTRADASLSSQNIFFVKDLSVLQRKEEKRLRDVCKELRASNSDGSKIFIKSGRLFKDGKVLDRIDISKQLF